MTPDKGLLSRTGKEAIELNQQTNRGPNILESSRLSCHLQCRHPTKTLVQVLAVSLLVQLPANARGKQRKLAQALGRHGWGFWLLPSRGSLLAPAPTGE